MKDKRTLSGIVLPKLDMSDLSGKLIVIEGTDGVGRSSQIQELKRWLEVKGYAVTVTWLGRSSLLGKALETAKMGHSLNAYTYSLLYLADFADCLEHQIVPALRAGYIVLADRYVYTGFARGIVRGVDKGWIRRSYGFALVPDMVFYLKIRVRELIPRILNSDNLEEGYWRTKTHGVIDYWESGMDMRMGEDYYDSLVKYQKSVISEFDRMGEEFGFRAIDASKSFGLINTKLQEGIGEILE